MINIDENFYTGGSSHTRKLTGTVYDALGNPIIEASAIIGENRTITDLFGNYHLIVTDKEEMIKVNFEGFDSKYIEISQNVEKFNITLTDRTTLDEIVVVGYKISETKRNMSYSATTNSSKKTPKSKDKEEDWKNFDISV